VLNGLLSQLAAKAQWLDDKAELEYSRHSPLKPTDRREAK
jgi:hypothetical protein